MAAEAHTLEGCKSSLGGAGHAAIQFALRAVRQMHIDRRRPERVLSDALFKWAGELSTEAVENLRDSVL